MLFCMLHMGAAADFTMCCVWCWSAVRCTLQQLRPGGPRQVQQLQRRCLLRRLQQGLRADRDWDLRAGASLQHVFAFPFGAQYAFLHVAAEFTMCCVCCWSAVRCTLQKLRPGGPRQVQQLQRRCLLRRLQQGLRADRDWDLRAGASLQHVFAFPFGAQYAFLHVVHGRSAADFTMCCVCFLSAVCCKLYV